MQFIAYRDLSNLSNMNEYKDITNDLDEILIFMSNIKATSGEWDGPENINVVFEVALANINIFMKKYQKNCLNAFILNGDASNQASQRSFLKCFFIQKMEEIRDIKN